MTPERNSAAPRPWAGPGMPEFIILMAALMASNAMAIDSMLPALPAIGDALGVAQENRRQLVITAYLLGFGFAQIVYGPLADRFGRKRLLVGGMLFYAFFGALAGLAGSFTLLLVSRALMGVSAAATRVLVIAVVRDRYHGSEMARIMSITTIVFMIVPVLAPTFGQAVLEFGTWRHIFIMLGIYGVLLALWTGVRLPETLAPENRRPLSPRSIGGAFVETVRNRISIGNSLAVTLAMGALFAFINSVQQIVFDVFEAPEMIGIVFACTSGPMAISSYVNSRLVRRYGSRKILLFALTSFTTMAVLHLAVAQTIGETLWTFALMQGLTMGCFGLIGANAGALAMEPLGHMAGTASSVQGLITTVGGALIGFFIGQHFDGTTTPFLIGFVICGAAALAVGWWANLPRSGRWTREQEEEEVAAHSPAEGLG